MKLVLTPAAEADLSEARDYLARISPRAAEDLLNRFDTLAETLASGLVRGREVTLEDGRVVRAWSMPPYTIYYRETADAVEVVRVYHQARRPLEQQD